MRLGLTILFCAASAMFAQQPPAAPPAKEAKPPAPQPQAATEAPVILEKKAYVRRFSAGITGGYSVLDMIKNEPIDQTVTNPYLRTRSSAESKSKKYIVGATLNMAVTGKWAVNVTGLYKWSGYNVLNEFFVIQNGNEVLFLTNKQETRSRYIESPIMVRRYNIDRFDQGWRWFFGAGGNMRYVTGINTTNIRTEQGNNPVITYDPAQPTKRFTYGATGGIGLQFVDDFGIRFVPEVRYTRWFGSTWDTFAAQSNRHQVEVLISFTF